MERRSRDLEIELKRDKPVELAVANGEEVVVAMAREGQKGRGGSEMRRMKYLGICEIAWVVCFREKLL